MDVVVGDLFVGLTSRQAPGARLQQMSVSCAVAPGCSGEGEGVEVLPSLASGPLGTGRPCVKETAASTQRVIRLDFGRPGYDVLGCRQCG